PDFAREVLFEPLGISDFHWMSGSDGVASPASGLRLTAPDLLLIGAMLVDGGQVDGRQVVPASWIEAASTPSVKTPDGLGYSNLWYIGETMVPAFGRRLKWVGGFGNGGQRLWLCPEAGIVCAINAGDYNKFERWIYPARIWQEIVLANA